MNDESYRRLAIGNWELAIGDGDSDSDGNSYVNGNSDGIGVCLLSLMSVLS